MHCGQTEISSPFLNCPIDKLSYQSEDKRRFRTVNTFLSCHKVRGAVVADYRGYHSTLLLAHLDHFR